MSTLPTLHLRGNYWRIMAPKWAFDPLSGAGAARNGGRFNARGVAALYVSEDLATAVAEYGQDMSFRPGTFCAYGLDVAGVLDLTDPRIQAALGISDTVLACLWKKIALIDKTIPPTQTLSQHLISLGYPGIKVRSAQRAEGRNIVLWRWNTGAQDSVIFRDPNQDLPSDQVSWR
jgi:RES domain-containing protein